MAKFFYFADNMLDMFYFLLGKWSVAVSTFFIIIFFNTTCVKKKKYSGNIL